MSIQSIGIDAESFAGSDPILTIADDVFAAMVDGEPGHLRPWTGDLPVLQDEMFAWVDVGGGVPGRVLLATERGTASRITRALLMLGEDEEVGADDFRDALGEVANVVGGNVKALVPDPGALSLPVVTHERPTTAGTLVHELKLDWRGHPLVISVWLLGG